MALNPHLIYELPNFHHLSNNDHPFYPCSVSPVVWCVKSCLLNVSDWITLQRDISNVVGSFFSSDIVQTTSHHIEKISLCS